MPEYKKIIKAAADEARQRLIADPSSDIHGTMYGYQHGCKCEKCRAAYLVYVSVNNVKSRKNSLEKLESNPNDKRHGTRNGYRIGCRCDKCRAEETRSMREYRARKRAEVVAC